MLVNNLNELNAVLNRTQIDVLKALTNTCHGSKEEFIADDSMSIPRSCYDNYDYEEVRRNLDELLSIDLSQIEMEPWKALLYKDVLDFSIERNSFVIANYDLTHTTGARKEDVKKRFNEFQEKLYGWPDKKVYDSILKFMLNTINARTLTDEEKKQYEELLSLLPEIPENAEPLYAPDSKLISRLHDRAVQFYEPFLKHIPDQDRFELIDVYHIANEILDTEFAGRKGSWKAIYDENRSFASVDQIKREINFPGKRNEAYYTKDSLTMLLVHEMGVHFLRELPFDTIDMETVRTGLRGYEVIEEGIAVSLSQAVISTFAYSGLIHYISAGLAHFHKLSFRQVFEIQRRLQALYDNVPVGRSYDSVNRAFRGTYELINCKDLAYFNGSNKIWHYIEANIDSPLLFDSLLNTGKIDIFNPDQQYIMSEIRKTL